MKPGVQPGDHVEYTVEVTEPMLAQLNGQVIHPLYGTAAMITHMEWASRQHILPYLEPHEEGVGYHVNIKHLAPAPLGATVRVSSTVTEVTANRVESHVEAWYGQRQIGVGTLVQALVSQAQLYEEASLPPAECLPPQTAQLRSLDGNSCLSLQIYGLETLMPCTRYDEWLIAELQVKDGTFNHQEKGPFILLYELNEWAEQLTQLVPGKTDFLQAPFQCQLDIPLDGQAPFQLELLAPQKPGETTPPKSWHSSRFQVSTTSLKTFAQALKQQIEAFPDS